MDINWKTMANDMRGLLPTMGQNANVKAFVSAWLPLIEEAANSKSKLDLPKNEKGCGPCPLFPVCRNPDVWTGNAACIEARREFAFKEAASKRVKILKKGENMPPSSLLFSFENQDVASRFVDGAVAIPNMKGVTIKIMDDVQESTAASKKEKAWLRLSQWLVYRYETLSTKDRETLNAIINMLRYPE